MSISITNGLNKKTLSPVYAGAVTCTPLIKISSASENMAIETKLAMMVWIRLLFPVVAGTQTNTISQSADKAKR